MWKASCASTLLPVKISSFALALPISLGSSCVPPALLCSQAVSVLEARATVTHTGQPGYLCQRNCKEANDEHYSAVSDLRTLV